ncbi:MAG: WcaF family extracellular polysaccharide biosynthesis acetyltransferase [Cyanobium sp.]
MNYQNLATYRPLDSWSPGASYWVQILWFCAGSPLLAARWLPGSAWRVLMLRLFRARIGKGCRIKPGLRVKFPWRLGVGDHCWLGEAVWIDNLASVNLGDHVCISQGAYLCTGNHDLRSPGFDLLLAPISVGSEVWIAASSVIAPGTTIGVGAVIALASVVSGNVPPGAILRGNPAVLIRQRHQH